MAKIVLTENDLRRIVRNVFRKVTNKANLSDGIHEITDEAQLKQYSQTIWNILQFAYKDLGGFKGYDSIEEMLNLMSFATLCVNNGRIVACAIYRADLGGQKLNGCGTIDGKEENKAILRSVIKNDIENLKWYRWVEVSYPLEKWFKELGGNPIPTVLAHKLLHKAKGKIQDLNDGVHYKREMGKDKEIVTKAIYGFQSEAVYNKVVQNIEQMTGFQTYEEYKQHINSLPKITEDIDTSFNHEDKTISVAMEVIIQIGNLWEEGVKEMTPNMHEYLLSAINILKSFEPKNEQIIALIKNGTYYLNNMDVLTYHECDDYDYIIRPAI